MKQRYGSLAKEFLFTIAMLIVLKGWIFPLFVYLWFPVDDLSSHMLELIDIALGLFSCLIYIGFGSIAKHQFRLSFNEACLFFFCLHSFLLFPKLPLLGQWQKLFADVLALYLPMHSLLVWPYLFFAFSCFITGRKLLVREKEIERTLQRQPEC